MGKYSFQPLHIMLAVVVGGLLVVGPLQQDALAADIVYGYVQHVSVDNIKIRDVQGSGTETFTLVPSFDQIFSVDGKTTYQMKDLLPGDFVKIYSDKGLLGKRADKIIVEKARK
jgi:hypothetical protein